MKKVRIGIVGVGYWGPNLVRSFSQIDSCELLYCCDLRRENLEHIKKLFPFLTTTMSYKQLLNDSRLDAVVVATPSDTHKSLVLQALSAGKHVLVEKPLALSVNDAAAMLKESKKQKKILMVGHTYEYNRAIEYIRDYIQSGKLGDLYYIYGARVNLGKIREETNALWNLAPHDFSALRFILDQTPKEIAAFGGAYLQQKNEDVAFVNIRFNNNIIAHLHVSWLDPSKKRMMTFVGSKKMIVFDDMDNEAPIRIYDKGVSKVINEKKEHLLGVFTIKMRSGDIHMPYIKREEPLYRECFHFIDCILNNKKPRSNGIVGLEVVKMLETAQQSLNKGGAWIRLS